MIPSQAISINLFYQVCWIESWFLPPKQINQIHEK